VILAKTLRLNCAAVYDRIFYNLSLAAVYLSSDSMIPSALSISRI